MFRLLKTSRYGRRGVLETSHGKVQTPAFMPIATKASVKSLTPEELQKAGAEILLSNTYHLMLQPGVEILKKAKGLHKFMQWSGPILTDSGGYQVFSLARLRKITNEGVDFRSHRDGSKHFLTPERSIEIQKVIGPDIMMVLDDVQAPDVAQKRVDEAVTRTSLWAKRSLAVKRKRGQKMFGIVQGGIYKDLRTRSADELTKLPFDGFAVGGLAVGETEEQMFTMTSVVTQKLPTHKPRYFMGGAKPEQMVALIARGIDMFDCVIPTREARHGRLYIWKHKNLKQKDFYTRMNIINAQYATDMKPVSNKCDCYTCQHFTRAYLRHLFVAEEPLALRLATLHNVHFYLSLLAVIRKKI